jgi:hypothetical protein
MTESLSISWIVLGDSKFCEGNLVALDEPSPDFEFDGYDYESDSDLGYFSEDELPLEDVSRTPDPGYDEMKKDRPRRNSNDTADYKLCSYNHGRAGNVVVIKDSAYVTRVPLSSLCLMFF